MTARTLTLLATILLSLPARLAAATSPLDAPEPDSREESEAVETPSDTAQPSGFHKAWRVFLDDGKYLFTFPRRPTKKGVILTSSWLAVTGYLITRDEDIREWVWENRNETSGKLERIFEPIGRAETGILFTGGTYLIGRWSNRPKLKKTGAVAFEAWLYTGAVTAAAKGLFAREGSSDPESTGQFWEGGDIFPSGHTSRTFAIAAVFAESYGKKAAWIGYPIAGLVGLARIENSSHWASDVVAGAGLGIAIGRAIGSRHFGGHSSLTPTIEFLDDGGVHIGVRIPVGRAARRKVLTGRKNTTRQAAKSGPGTGIPAGGIIHWIPEGPGPDSW
jgi:hypothetical protein